MADRWYEVPITLYTGKQVAAREKARLDALKKRTVDRSEDSVAEAVELLRQLVDLPERRDLRVALCWTLKENGEVGRASVSIEPTDARKICEWLHALGGMRSFYDGRVLVLNQDGLHRGTVLLGGGHNWGSAYDEAQLTRVTEREYAEVARRYQLFPTQLSFLIKQLQAEVA